MVTRNSERVTLCVLTIPRSLLTLLMILPIARMFSWKPLPSFRIFSIITHVRTYPCRHEVKKLLGRLEIILIRRSNIGILTKFAGSHELLKIRLKLCSILRQMVFLRSRKSIIFISQVRVGGLS